MGHIEPEELVEPERIFIAARLREAIAVEALLTEAGIDYVVQVEPFARSLLFGLRYGAAFYVTSGEAARCRTYLSEQGFVRGVVKEQD